MYIKVFPHGQGGGHGPVNYLLRRDYPGRKEAPPQILRGDPALTRALIDAQTCKWKFSAGVCSWGPEDQVTPKQEKRLMDDFEETAFAGLEPDQYDILWVRHSHAGHHELHFVIPRQELSTGKAFNAFPPGWQKHFDPLRDLHNLREGWSRPDDPARARLHTPDQADLHKARLLRWGKMPNKDERAEAKAAIHAYLIAKIENGNIQNRADVLAALQEVGLEINRAGKDYLSVRDPESNQILRLKGGIYAECWQLTDQPGQPDRTPQEQDGRRTPDSREVDRNRIRELQCERARIYEKRARYHRERYRPRDHEHTREHGQPDQVAEQWLHQALVRVRTLGPGVDQRSGPRRLGPDNPGQAPHQQSTPRHNHPEPTKGQPGDNLETTGKQNLGPESGRKAGGPLHHSAAQSHPQNRLDFRQTTSRQTGVSHVGTTNPGPGTFGGSAPGIGISSDSQDPTAGRTLSNHQTPYRRPQNPGSATGRVRETLEAFERTLQSLAASYRDYQQRRQERSKMKNSPTPTTPTITPGLSR